VENHVTFDLWHTTVGMWDIFSTFLWCCSLFSLIFCITFRVSGHFTYSIHRKKQFQIKHADGGSDAVENHVTFDLWHATVCTWDLFSIFWVLFSMFSDLL
jgi:hypothetical protein